MKQNDRPFANQQTTKPAWVLAAGVLLSISAWAGPAANALPTGGTVQAGQAAITQNLNTLNVNQTSQRAVIGWNSFNVGKDATVNFNQPNANASTLNIVNGATKSMIDGAVNANGQVIFVNPNGVVFGKNAEVNVGGMVATTMSIDSNAYMAGGDTQTYSGRGTGKVVNKGRITVNDIKGYVALMAPEVINEGVITATLSGKNAVALVSGEQVTIQIQDRQMLSINVDASAIKSLIQNKRLIQVEGGQVLLAANAAKDLKNSVIQNTGVISATGITSNGGKISLRASTVTQSGTVAANSAAAMGGEVTITGNQVTLESGSVTSATGASGGGQILVGTTAAKPDAATPLAKTVHVKTNALVDASATQSGHGGTVAIWSSQTTTVAGVLQAKGGAVSGNGGHIETSSSGQVIYGASLVVDTSAAKGQAGVWTTDPVAIVVDSQSAAVLTRALSSTNVVLDATLLGCGGVGTCAPSTLPSITFLPGADVYSANALTTLTLNAVGGSIHIHSNIAAGQVYAVAQEISVPGSIHSTGGANGNIYLAGAALNILGRVGSNGSSGSTTSGAATGTVGATANRRRTSSGDALTSDGNIYTSDAGKVTLIATGDITLGSATDNSTTITANGIHGGAITIVSLNGHVKNYGVVDALGLNGSGGSISIAGSQRTDAVGALMSVDGLHGGGVFQIGVANAVGTGATLAPPSINAQVATLLAAINFSPTVSSTLLSAQTVLDSATLVSANAQASYSSQANNFSKAGSIYIAGNDSLNTSATIKANADIGGLILLSSPAGMYQNAGYIQTNGGAGLGGTIAQSGLVSTTLTGSTLEANGQLGGGNIVTGRDFQANPILNSPTQDALLPVLSSVVHFPTSAFTVIDATSRFSANALFGGNAGNILVWGNQLAAFGAFNAQALGATGNGGFIETSGQQLLLTDIQVSASANHGSSGTWLLDPFDVTIANSGASGTNYAAIFSAGSTSTILASSIVSHLNAGTNVSISTGSNSANTIFVTTPISATGGGSLTLTAGTIELQQNITTGGAQTFNGAVRLTNNITLTTTNSNVVFYTTVNGTSAGAQSLTIANGSGTVALGGNVGSSVALSSLNFSSSTATTLLGGSVTTAGSQNYAGSISVGGTTSSLNSNSGGITVGGTISSFAGGVMQFTGDGGYIYSGAASQTATSIPTLVGNWMVSWSGSSYSIVPLFNSTNLNYLVVAGGGGGGSHGGGGGGAGGLLQGSALTLSGGTTYTVTVGAGGAGGTDDYPTNTTGTGRNGSNSSLIGGSAPITASGGGGGGLGGFNGLSGGSGGGGGQGVGVDALCASKAGGFCTGGAGTSGQGNAGGTGYGNTTSANFPSGGGGGAGGAGANAPTSGSAGGAGGVGVSSSITGTSITYAVGGKGGSWNGEAGNGGGSSTINGASNTGGGGGGSQGINPAGSGGSGNVIVSGAQTQQGLTINAGTGAVTLGVVNNLTNLTVTGASTLNGNITTSGAQTYNSAVVLGGNITLTATNSNIVFNSTVDGTTSGAQALTIANGTGTIGLGANVGGSVALSTLNFSSATATTVLGGSVTTLGSQNYAGAMYVLGSSSALNSTSGGVTVSGTISSGDVIQFTGTSSGTYIYNGTTLTATSTPTWVGKLVQVSFSGSSFTVTPLFNSLNASYLVVGGGGGGGGIIGGGGGGGGVLTGTTNLTGATSIGVGTGGLGGVGWDNAGQQGSNGNSSNLGSIAAAGGGYGGAFGGKSSAYVNGGAGGSGGGGSGNGTGGSATAGQGNSGGNSTPVSGTGGNAGGGGGGAGAAGSAATTNLAGNGGAGLASNITGTTAYYGGGGGGGARTGNGGSGTAYTAGTGGIGGGGNGTNTTTAAGNGTANTGGGGGGAGYTTDSTSRLGGTGGSGIVVTSLAQRALAINAGTGAVSVSSASKLTSLTINSSSTSSSQSGSGVFTGSMNLTIAGTGAFTTTSNNTYTGITTVSSGATLNIQPSWTSNSNLTGGFVNNGTVNFSSNQSNNGSTVLFVTNASGSGAWNITSSTSGNSIYSNRLDFIGSPTTTGPITVTNYGNFWTEVTAGTTPVSFTSPVYLNGVNTVYNLWGVGTIGIGTLTGTGKVDFPSNGAGSTIALSVGNDNGTGTFSGVISNSGAQAGPTTLSLVKAGTGTQTLSGVNTYSGTTTVNNGTLAIGGTGQLGSGTYSATLTVASGATFTHGSSANQTFSGSNLAGAGTINLNGTGTVTISGTSAEAFTGVLNISQALNMTGFLNNPVTGLGNASLIQIKNGGTLTLVGASNANTSNLFLGYGSGAGVGITTVVQIDAGGLLTTDTSTNVNYGLGRVILAGGTISSGTTSDNTSTWGLFGFGNSITVTANSTINASQSVLTMTGGTVIDIAAGATLTLSASNKTFIRSTNNSDTGIVLNQSTSCTGGCTGTLLISTANTQASAITVKAGTLKVGHATALGTGAVTVQSGGVLDLNGTTMTGTNALTLNGTGISSGGALTNSSSTAATYAGAITLASASSIASSNGGITVSGVISGSGNLSIEGTSAITFTRNNTYTGSTTVSSGATLNIQPSWTSNSNLTGGFVNNGTVNFSSNQSNTGSTVLFVTNASGSGAWNITSSTSGNSIYSNRLDFIGSPTTTGPITVTNYGNFWTEVAAGTTPVSFTSPVYLNGSNTVYNLYGLGTIGIGTLTGTGKVDMPDKGPGSTITLNIGNDNGTGTFSGVISNSGAQAGPTTLSVAKVGTGTQTLSGVNTYSGTTTVNNGTLAIGGAGQLGSGTYSATLTVASGATFTHGSSANQTFSNSNLAGAGTINLSGTGSSTVTVTGNGLSTGSAEPFSGVLNISQPFSIGSGFLNQVSSGFGNATLIQIKNGGTLTLNTSGVQNSLVGSNVGNTVIQIDAGGTLTTDSNTGATFHFPALILAGGTLTSAASTNTSGFGLFNFDKTITVTANSTISAPQSALTMTGGTVIDIAAGVTLTVNGSQTFTHSASGADNGLILNKNTTCTGGCSGTLIMSSANTYTGGTTLTAGTLKVANGTALGAGSVTVASGAVLDLNGTTVSGTNALTLNGTGISSAGALTNSTATAVTYAGSITLGTTASSIGSGGGNITLSGAIGGTTGLTINGGAGQSAAVKLSGNNTYTGGTTVSSGTLQVGSTTALGASGSAVTVSSGAVLDLNGNAIANSLILNGTGISSGGALTNSHATAGSVSGTVALSSTSSVGGNAGSITLGGVVSGSSALTKIGTNTLTLSAANSYSGGTSLSAGMLVVSNNTALGSGALTMSASTILQAGATTVSLSNPIAMSGAATINAPAGNTLTLSGVLSGAGTPTVNSGTTGTVLFTNSANTFGSATAVTNITVSGGILGIVGDGSLGVTPSSVQAASIKLSGGVLQAYGLPSETNATTVALSTNRGITLTAASGLAATATTNSGTTYIDSLQVQGIVMGAYALTINGANQAGMVKLAGANTYSGGTTISSGTLVDANATGLGSSTAALTISNSAKLDLQSTLTVGSLSMSAGSQIINTAGTSALTVSGASTLGNTVTTSGTQTYNGNITLNGNTSLTSGFFSFSNSTTSGAYALSLLPYGSSFTGTQSLAGLSLATSTTSFTLGSSSNSVAVTMPVNITIAGPITVYGGAVTVSANLRNTNATANAGIRLLASGAFTLDNSKTITTTNAGIVVTGSQIVINNPASNAIAAGGTGNYWNIWSANNSPYNATAGLADKMGGLVNDFKQYNINYGAVVSGTGNGLLFTYAPSLSFALTGTVTKAYDGTTAATLASGNYSVSGNVGGDVITYTQPTSGTYAASVVGTGLAVSTTGISFTSAASSTGKPVYGYQIAGTSAAGNVGVITAKQLTASLAANNKVYDANTAATGTLTLSGFITGDTGTVTASSLTFASADVAYSGSTVVAKTVTASGLSLGAGLSNYVLASTTVTGGASITPAPLTITSTNQAGFVTRAPSLSGTGFVASGLIGGQSIATVNLSTTATSSSAAANYPLTISTATASAGTTLGNYSVTYVPGTYTVVPADGLLISSNGVSTPYGTNASVVPLSISYLVSGGASITTLTNYTVSNGIYTFADGASGAVSFSLVPTTGTNRSGSGNVNVGSYVLTAANFTPSANLAANAPLVVTGNYIVTPKSVSVAATSATTTYSASAQTQGYTSGILSGDLVTINGLATGTDAGTYSSKLSATGTDKNNYTLAFTNANLTISPATLTVIGSSNSSTYNASALTNSVAAVSGFLGSDSGTVSGYATGTNVGSYADNLAVTAVGNTRLSNYTLSITNGSLSIGKAALTVTGAATSVTYNGLNQTNASAVVTGGQGSDSFTVSGLASAKNAGAYADSLSVSAIGSTLLSNYNIIKINGSLTVGKANLSVIGANNTVTYSASTQTNTGATIVGTQGVDSFTVNGYGAGINIGTYNDALNLSGVGSTLTSNYNITYNNGALTVTPAALTITGASTTRTYTSAALSNSFTTTGLLSPDTVTGLSGLAARTNVGTSADQLSNATGSGLTNYTITYVNGSLTVAPATLTITGAATTQVYTAVAQNNTFSTAGLLGSDSVSAVSGSASAIQVGTVADQLSAATGTGLSNYNINYVNGSLTITQAPLTITGATTTNRVYTSTLQTNTYTTNGLLRSDAVTGVSGLATGTNVGTTTDNLSSATGAGLSNYNITYVNGSLTITRAPLTITGGTTSSTYTALAQTNSYAVSGLLGSDAVTGVSGVATRTNFGTTNDALSSAVGSGLGNYTISYVNGALSVTKAALTITGATTTNVYSGAAQSNKFNVSGLLGTDTVTGVAGIATATNVGTTADNMSTATGQGITNYTVRYVNGSLTITPAALTIAANNAASFVSKPIEALSYTSSGLLGTDTISTVTLSTTATSSSAADTYPITVSNAVGTGLGNYTITYQPASYTVVPAGKLLITTTGTSATYASPTAASPATVSYLSPVDNTTIANLSQTSAVTSNGVTTYSYSDSLTPPTTVSFTIGVTNPVLSGSGNLGVGVYGLTVGSFTKTGSNLTSNTATVTGNTSVNPLAASITAATTSKAYTAALQTAASNTAPDGYTSAGLISGDNLTVAGIANGTNVGSYQSTLSVAGSDAGNYTFTIANNPLNITPVGLTITGGNTTSTYNATTRTNSAALSVSGLKGNDAVISVSGLATGKDVGSYSDALFNATGTGLGNYSITYINGGLTVTPAYLTAALSANSKVYDATPNATGSVALNGVFGSDSVNAAASSMTFADALVGTAKAVTASNISLSGNASHNYRLNNTSATATADITPAALTITGSTTSSVYNGTTQSNSSSFTTTGLFGADQVTSVNGQASGKNVGTFTDVLTNATGRGLSNYAITYSNGAITITPATLNVTGASSNGTYNGTQQTNTYQVMGLQGADGLSVTGVASGLNAGNYNDNLVVAPSTGTSLGNYSLTTTNGSLAIARAPISAVLSANDKMYDATTAATGTVSLRGLFGSDVVVGTPSAISFSDANVGTAKAASATGVSLSGAAAANYVLTSSTANGQANITSAPLTIAVNNQAGFVTQPINTLTYSVTGLLGSDSVSSASMFTTAGPNTSAGIYPLTISGAQGSGVSNYAITYQAGTYTVVPAGQVLVVTNGSTTAYGSTLQAPSSVSASYLDPTSSLINPLTLSSSNSVNDVTTYVFTDGAGGSVNVTFSAHNPITSGAGKLRVGIYGIGLGTFSKSGTNLTSDTATVTGDYIVTPLATTITANNQSLVYSSGLQTAGYSSSGLLAQDNVVVSGRASGTNVGSYQSNLSTSGYDVSNYAFTYVNRSFAITPAALTIAGATTSSVYNGAQQTNSFTSSGLLGSDSVSAVSGQASGTTVGTYNDALSGATGTGLSNYNITYTNGSMAITPAPLTVTGSTTTRVYTAAAQTNSAAFTSSGLLGSDSVSAVSGQASGTTVGTYNDALSGATGTGLSNYNITYTNGSMAITPKALQISGSSSSKIATGSVLTNLATFTTNGLVGSDLVSAVSGQATGTNAGTYTDNLNSATGTGLSNYSITYVNGTLEIKPAPANAASNAAGALMGGGSSASSAGSSNVISGGSTTSSSTSTANTTSGSSSAATSGSGSETTAGSTAGTTGGTSSSGAIGSSSTTTADAGGTPGGSASGATSGTTAGTSSSGAIGSSSTTTADAGVTPGGSASGATSGTTAGTSSSGTSGSSSTTTADAGGTPGGSGSGTTAGSAGGSSSSGTSGSSSTTTADAGVTPGGSGSGTTAGSAGGSSSSGTSGSSSTTTADAGVTPGASTGTTAGSESNGTQGVSQRAATFSKDPSASSTTSIQGIKISINFGQSQNPEGLRMNVVVEVSRSITQSMFEVLLPNQVVEFIGKSQISDVAPQAKLATGVDLPEWIKFDPESLKFVIEKGQSFKMPQKVEISLGEKRITVDLIDLIED